MSKGAKLEVLFSPPSVEPRPPPQQLAAFNAREMVAHGTHGIFQVSLDSACMKDLRDHAVLAANVKRSRSKNFPHGQVGIFPGSYLRFAKRDGAWELDDNHADFVRLGFSIKLVREFAAK